MEGLATEMRADQGNPQSMVRAPKPGITGQSEEVELLSGAREPWNHKAEALWQELRLWREAAARFLESKGRSGEEAPHLPLPLPSGLSLVPTLATPSQELVNKRGLEVQCPQVSFLRPEQSGVWTRVGQELMEISQKSRSKINKIPAFLQLSFWREPESRYTPTTPPLPKMKKGHDPVTLSAVEKNRAGAELEVEGAVLNRVAGGL